MRCDDDDDDDDDEEEEEEEEAATAQAAAVNSSTCVSVRPSTPRSASTVVDATPPEVENATATGGSTRTMAGEVRCGPAAPEEE